MTNFREQTFFFLCHTISIILFGWRKPETDLFSVSFQNIPLNLYDKKWLICYTTSSRLLTRKRRCWAFASVSRLQEQWLRITCLFPTNISTAEQLNNDQLCHKRQHKVKHIIWAHKLKSRSYNKQLYAQYWPYKYGIMVKTHMRCKAHIIIMHVNLILPSRYPSYSAFTNIISNALFSGFSCPWKPVGNLWVVL